jgi:hypothetical protein
LDLFKGLNKTVEEYFILHIISRRNQYVRQKHQPVDSYIPESV